MPYETQQPAGTTQALETNAAEGNGLLTPLRGFRFTADFGTLGITSFKSVTGGFGATVDAQEYREGGFASLTNRKVPGLVSYDPMRLEKGMYSSTDLYDWFCSYLCGETVNPVQKAIITVYDNQGAPQAKWEMYNAWPSHYESGDLNADDSSILIETLEIQHEGIQRIGA